MSDTNTTTDNQAKAGVHHPDERVPLACVYDGCGLRAILYSEREVERYHAKTTLTVSFTPAGEERLVEGGDG